MIYNPYNWTLFQSEFSPLNLQGLAEKYIKIALVNVSEELAKNNYLHPSTNLIAGEDKTWNRLRIAVKNESSKAITFPQEGKSDVFELMIAASNETEAGVVEQIRNGLKIEAIGIQKQDNGNYTISDVKVEEWDVSTSENNTLFIKPTSAKASITLQSNELFVLTFEALAIDQEVKEALDVHLKLNTTFRGKDKTINWKESFDLLKLAQKEKPSLREVVAVEFKKAMVKDRLQQHNPEQEVWLSIEDQWEVENSFYFTMTFSKRIQFTEKTKIKLTLEYGKDADHSMILEGDADRYELGIRQEGYPKAWGAKKPENVEGNIHWEIKTKGKAVTLEEGRELEFLVSKIVSKTEEGDGYIRIDYQGVEGYKNDSFYLRLPKRIPEMQVLSFSVEPEKISSPETELQFSWQCIGWDLDSGKAGKWQLESEKLGLSVKGLPYSSASLAETQKAELNKHAPIVFKDKDATIKFDFSLDASSGSSEMTRWAKVSPVHDIFEFKLSATEAKEKYKLGETVKFEVHYQDYFLTEQRNGIIWLGQYYGKIRQDFVLDKPIKEVSILLDPARIEHYEEEFNLYCILPEYTTAEGQVFPEKRGHLKLKIKRLKPKRFDLFPRFIPFEEDERKKTALEWSMIYAVERNTDWVIWERYTDTLIADNLQFPNHQSMNYEPTDGKAFELEEDQGAWRVKAPVFDYSKLKIHQNEDLCLDLRLLPKSLFDAYRNNTGYSPFVGALLKQRVYPPFVHTCDVRADFSMERLYCDITFILPSTSWYRPDELRVPVEAINFCIQYKHGIEKDSERIHSGYKFYLDQELPEHTLSLKHKKWYHGENSLDQIMNKNSMTSPCSGWVLYQMKFDLYNSYNSVRDNEVPHLYFYYNNKHYHLHWLGALPIEI